MEICAVMPSIAAFLGDNEAIEKRIDQLMEDTQWPQRLRLRKEEGKEGIAPWSAEKVSGISKYLSRSLSAAACSCSAWSSRATAWAAAVLPPPNLTMAGLYRAAESSTKPCLTPTDEIAKPVSWLTFIILIIRAILWVAELCTNILPTRSQVGAVSTTLHDTHDRTN